MNEQTYSEYLEAEARHQSAEMHAVVAEVNRLRVELAQCIARTTAAQRAERAAFEALTAAKKRRDAAFAPDG